MIRRILLAVLFLMACKFDALCQAPPSEFFDGIKVFTTNEPEAKRDFLIAVQKDSMFHGSYHFLGVISLHENKNDSAIYYFKKSIALNKENVNHTREMTYVRLINTYTYLHDFKNGFDVAWQALNLYPESQSITASLRDLCLWAFYIHHDGLDPAYLSPDIRKEYLVNSISIEYLILRKLRVKEEYLVMTRQSLVTEKNDNYDVFDCTLSTSKTNVTVRFKLNWDLSKFFGGKIPATGVVIDDKNSPVYDRIGAMLVADSKIDLKKEIEEKIKG